MGYTEYIKGPSHPRPYLFVLFPRQFGFINTLTLAAPSLAYAWDAQPPHTRRWGHVFSTHLPTLHSKPPLAPLIPSTLAPPVSSGVVRRILNSLALGQQLSFIMSKTWETTWREQGGRPKMCPSHYRFALIKTLSAGQVLPPPLLLLLTLTLTHNAPGARPGLLLIWPHY